MRSWRCFLICQPIGELVGYFPQNRCSCSIFMPGFFEHAMDAKDDWKKVDLGRFPIETRSRHFGRARFTKWMHNFRGGQTCRRRMRWRNNCAAAQVHVSGARQPYAINNHAHHGRIPQPLCFSASQTLGSSEQCDWLWTMPWPWQATTQKKDVIRDQTQELRAKWILCAVSGEPLKNDVLTCDLGYLFDKESILRWVP